MNIQNSFVTISLCLAAALGTLAGCDTAVEGYGPDDSIEPRDYYPVGDFLNEPAEGSVEPPAPEARLVIRPVVPTAPTVAIGDNDAEVMCFSITAEGADIEVSRLRLTIVSVPTEPVAGGLYHDGASAPNYTDIKVMDVGTGATWYGPRDVLVYEDGAYADDRTQTLDLNDWQTYREGQTKKHCVTMDVRDNFWLDGDTVYLTLQPLAEDDLVATNGADVTDAYPDGPIQKGFSVVGAFPPTISLVSLPTSTLSNGVHSAFRFSVTAQAESDVGVKKLSFVMNVSNAGLTTDMPELREVGASLGLEMDVAEVLEGGAELCGFPAAPVERCVVIVLEEPYWIPAGQSRTFDLRVRFMSVSSDTVVSTGLVQDIDPVSGPLSGTDLWTGVGDFLPSIIWSSNGYQWYNSATITWSPAGVQTLVAP